MKHELKQVELNEVAVRASSWSETDDGGHTQVNMT